MFNTFEYTVPQSNQESFLGGMKILNVYKVLKTQFLHNA